jgi:hypothetical protein
MRRGAANHARLALTTGCVHDASSCVTTMSGYSRFHSRIRLLPGVHVNVSKRNVPLSFGGPSASLNLGRRYAELGSSTESPCHCNSIGAPLPLPSTLATTCTMCAATRFDAIALCSQLGNT